MNPQVSNRIIGHSHPLLAELLADDEYCPRPEQKAERSRPIDPSWMVSSPVEAGARIRQNFRIAELERSVRELRVKLDSLEKLGANSLQAMKEDSIRDPRLIDVVLITKSIFAGDVKLDVFADPEVPNAPFLSFSVSSNDAVKVIVEKRREWHRRVSAIPPGSSGQFRLLISPSQ